MKNTFYLLLFAMTFWSACTSSRSGQISKGEDYFVFYQKFHQDSLFQVERVRFPLDGYSIEGGQITSWDENSWVMHKNGLADIDTSIYKTERNTRFGVIQERIYLPNSGMLIERHFSLLNKKWFLTFYLYIFL